MAFINVVVSKWNKDLGYLFSMNLNNNFLKEELGLIEDEDDFLTSEEVKTKYTSKIQQEI